MSINEQHETRTLKLLLDSAMEGRTLHYEDIAQHLGTPLRGNALGAAISPLLGAIFNWCQQRGMPYLTSIVVRKSGTDKGIPGAGFWDLAGKRDLRRCDKVTWTEQYQRGVWAFWKLNWDSEYTALPVPKDSAKSWPEITFPCPPQEAIDLNRDVSSLLTDFYNATRRCSMVDVQETYTDEDIVWHGHLENQQEAMVVTFSGRKLRGVYLEVDIKAPQLRLEAKWNFGPISGARMVEYRAPRLTDEMVECIRRVIEQATITLCKPGSVFVTQ